MEGKEKQFNQTNIAKELHLLGSSLLVLLANEDSLDLSDIKNIVCMNLSEYLDILKNITKDDATNDLVSSSLVRIHGYLLDIKKKEMLGESSLAKDCLEVTDHVLRLYSISIPESMHESLDSEVDPEFQSYTRDYKEELRKFLDQKEALRYYNQQKPDIYSIISDGLSKSMGGNTSLEMVKHRLDNTFDKSATKVCTKLHKDMKALEEMQNQAKLDYDLSKSKEQQLADQKKKLEDYKWKVLLDQFDEAYGGRG